MLVVLVLYLRLCRGGRFEVWGKFKPVNMIMAGKTVFLGWVLVRNVDQQDRESQKKLYLIKDSKQI